MSTVSVPSDLLDCARLRGEVETVALNLARWAYRDDGKAQPGVRQAANEAVAAIDAALAELGRMRGRLVDQIRQSDDAAAARVDQLLAQSRTARQRAGQSDVEPDTAAARAAAELPATVGQLAVLQQPAALSCPSWCTSVHEPVDPALAVTDDLVVHDVVVAAVPTLSPAEGPATVDVGVCDCTPEGRRSAPMVFVSCRDALDPAGARQLAAGLLRAAQLAEDWSR